MAEYWFDRDKKNIPRDVWPHDVQQQPGNQRRRLVDVVFRGSILDARHPMAADESTVEISLRRPRLRQMGLRGMWKNKRIGGLTPIWVMNPAWATWRSPTSRFSIRIRPRRSSIKLWDGNKATAHAKEESGPTYYRIHAGRSLGTIRWDAWTDIPTSTVYQDAAGKTVVAVYNTAAQAKTCRLFEKGQNTATFQVPARRLIAWSAGNKMPLPPLDTTLTAVPLHAPSPAPGGAPVLTRIQVDPPVALMSDRNTQRFIAKGFDQFGKPVAITPVWSVQGKGSIDAGGLYTPNGGGNFAEPRFGISAAANGITGNAWAAVEESRRVSRIVLDPESPNELRVATGATMRFQAEATDQFAARYVCAVTWSATGNVQVSRDGRITAGAPGDGSFTAEAGGQKITVPVKVLSPDQVNLAAMKTVIASSSENAGSEARFAVDGNDKTRWASAFSDPQWITVDLEAPYALRKIVLNWQNAAARVYEIELSADGTHWTSAARVADGKPGVRVFDLSGGGKSRYVRVTGTQRTTGYGYSLYEIEAYGMP